jgi:hypothetical protein
MLTAGTAGGVRRSLSEAVTASSSDDRAQLPWVEPDWLDEAHAWISNALDRRGLVPAGEVEQTHVYWWSTVLRVPTTMGVYWFKAVAPAHTFEVALTEFLARVAPDRLPEVLAADAQRGWMLLGDGGTRLRELVGSASDLGRWAEALPLYAELQIDVAPRLEELLALGVPDARLGELPRLLRRLLDGPDPLLLQPPEGLTAGELEDLAAALPAFEAACRELAGHGIPETIQHDDLHDGQVFLQHERYLILDWGDSCVSHPFHTLVVTLRSIAYKLGLEPGARELQRLRDAYLEPWTRFAPAPELQAAFALAYRIGTVGRALAWHRYVSARAPGSSAEDADAVPYGLRLYLAAGPIGSWR